MKILIDADFLIALVKEDDINHNRAVKKAKLFEEALLFITPFCIPEAATVLSYKVSHKTAKEFLRETRKRRFIEVYLDKKITELADGIFLSQNKKGTSWVDCLNIAVVEFYQLDGILSFDKFYKERLV